MRDYYQTIILAEETDPDKLHDILGTLDQHQVYSWNQVDGFVEAYLNGADRSLLDPVLEHCTDEYKTLDEDRQVEFKGSAKAFVRLYAFLSQVLPYGNPRWEKLSIFLNFLIPKLPVPKDEDLSRGILEVVDMESYRTERKAAISISLAEEDAEIDPVLSSSGGQAHEPEMDRLSNIVAEFNRMWGEEFTEPERVTEIINRMPDRSWRTGLTATPGSTWTGRTPRSSTTQRSDASSPRLSGVRRNYTRHTRETRSSGTG